MKTKIIGLMGPAGSGKSLVAKHLVEHYSGRVYTLAAPLKVIVGSAFELSDEQLYGTQDQKEAVDPRYNVSPRWLFQRIGTEGIRKAFGEDVWVNYLLDKVNTQNPILAVCDDVRFTNESAGLRKAGGKIIKLECGAITTTDTHASETQWTKAEYDYVVKHDGKTLTDLISAIDAVMLQENIFKRPKLGWY